MIFPGKNRSEKKKNKKTQRNEKKNSHKYSELQSVYDFHADNEIVWWYTRRQKKNKIKIKLKNKSDDEIRHNESIVVSIDNESSFKMWRKKKQKE